MEPTHLHLVRHGSTVVSDEGRFSGASDVALSDRGRDEAKRLGRRLAGLDFVAIYTSPMTRCIDTATALAASHDLKPQTRSELLEVDHGRWEGLTRSEVQTRFPEEYVAWEEDPFSFAPQGGTTGASVVARVMPFLHQIAREHAGRQVLVVSHKATIRLLVAILLGIDPRRYRDFLGQQPCALNILELREPTRAKLRLFNDVSYLSDD